MLVATYFYYNQLRRAFIAAQDCRCGKAEIWRRPQFLRERRFA